MDNNIILSMKARSEDYKIKALIAAIIGIPLFVLGIWVFSLIFTDQVYEPDIPAVFILALVLFWIGMDVSVIAIGTFSKYKKARCTYIEITQQEIKGQICARNFSIKNDELISCSLQVCSVVCDSYGVPRNMNPGLFMKLNAETNTYLCIVTSSGITYYIDGLTSPEVAKNTIDAIIAQKAASRSTI